ncbi:MAG: prepilin-type N-terminal cleavage/methylation domain-containing protein [Nitrospinota bacterium]
MDYIRKALKGEKGFTLIELLVVVAIIGILVAIAIPQFASYKKQANDGAVKSDLRNMAVTMESYYASNNQYPAGALAVVTAAMIASGWGSSTNVTITALLDTGGGNVAATTTAWTAKAVHSGGTKTFTWDSSKGGLQ